MPSSDQTPVTIHTAQRESKDPSPSLIQHSLEQIWKEIETLCSEIGIISVPDFTSASLSFKHYDLSSPTQVFEGSLDAFGAYLQGLNAINLDTYTSRLFDNHGDQTMDRKINDFFTFLEKKTDLQKQHALLKSKVQAYQQALEALAAPSQAKVAEIKEIGPVSPQDSLYNIVKLSRESAEDAKQYGNYPFNDEYGYRVTSKWRYEPMGCDSSMKDASSNCIYLSKLHGDDLADNCKIFGSFIKLSLDKGFQGKLYFKIAFGGPMDRPTNLIMLLKLGMIPAADQDYLKFNFGIRHSEFRDALTALNDCKTADELSDEHCNSLVKMIATMRKYGHAADFEKITEDTITKDVLFLHKDLLVALQNKRLMHPDFIPAILQILEEYPDQEHYPIPDIFVNMPLIMSEEGIARWKTAIEENKPFEPFDFEQLEQVMSAEQVHKLCIVYPKFLSKSERYKQLHGTINHFFKEVNTDRSSLTETIIVPSTNPEIEGLIATYAFN